MAENNDQLQEAKKLLEELNRLRGQLNKQPLRLTDDEAIRQLKSLPRDIEATRRELEATEFTASGLYNILRGVTSEFKSQRSGVLKVRGAFRQLEEAAQNLKLDEQNIVDLNKDQVVALEEKLLRSKAIVDQEARNLVQSNQIGKYLQRQVEARVQEGQSSDIINEYVSKILQNTKNLTEEQKALLQSYFDQDNVVDGILDKTRQRIDLEDKISSLVGVTGALVEGTGALMQRLGMRSGIFHDAMQESAETMRQMAKDTAYGVKSFSKLQIAAKGFSILSKGFGKALRDPLTITLAIVDGFLDVNKAAVEFTRLTGENATAVAGLNSRLATSVEVLETAAELTRQIGISATAIFSPGDLGRLAEAKNLLGISAEQAGNLGLRSKVAGQTIDGFQDSLLAGVDAGNRLAKSAVAPGIALQDALSASDGITLSFGKNTKELGKAATAARALGLELSRVDQIAEGLLNFESSIEAELEAQLLTGKQINLAKARELALNNDLAGLSQELAKNGASAAEFSRMNRIQQNALAKSLGMSRDELAKTILTQEAAANLTDEQRAKVLGVTKEQLQQIDIQQRIEKSLSKLAQAFAPILDALVPVVEVAASLLQPLAKLVAMVAGPLGSAFKTGFGQVVIGVTLAAVAIKKLTGGLTKIGSVFGSIVTGAKNVGQSIISAFTSPGETLKKLKDSISSIKESFMGGLQDKVQSKAGDWYDADSPQGKMIRTKGGTQPLDGGLKEKLKPEELASKKQDIAEDLSDKAKKTTETPEPTSSGQKLKEFFQNLSEGLKSMSQKGVLKGALNLIPSSLGLVAMIPGAAGAKLIELVNGPKFQSALTGIANGLAIFGNMVTPAGIAKFAASGLAFAAFSAGAIGLGVIALLGAPAGTGLTALGTGLTAFAQAMSIPTPFGPVGLVAPAALALLGGALIPFAAALRIAAPAFTAFGAAVKLAFEGVAAIVSAVMSPLTEMFSMLTLEKAVAVAALGPAFASVGAGLIALGAGALLGIAGLGVLTAISAIGPGLQLAGQGVTQMAEGVAKLSSALQSLETEKLKEVKDLITTSALAAPAVAATGAITQLINGITGGGESSNKELVDKLDQVIVAVSNIRGNVYMDGHQVGNSIFSSAQKTS